jgi:SpoIIAA-like
MPIEIEYEPNEICVLRIRGVLKQSEFAAKQKALADKIDVGAKPRVLAIVENFEGFERGADWNDLDFLLSHSGEIAKIAIVAERRWEVQALAFAGAGVRRAPVKFFSLEELAAARTWLTQ